MPVYVDCTNKGQNEELQKEYKVQGYPTVLYVDPAGKQIKEMGSREASAITGEIGGVAKKFPGRLTFWNNSVKSAAAAAKASKKLVAVYVAGEDADFGKIHAALNKNLGDRRMKLAWTYENGTAKAHGLDSAPGVVIYEVGEKATDLKMLGKVTITKGDDPKLLNDGIDEIVKNATK